LTISIAIALAAIVGLALLDLWVGVANDAVNFLNSAIGSRVATRRLILAVASVGVLLGALSSSGMMEIARRGVFDPDRFLDADGALMLGALLAVYLGVMAADVVMLDLFNTFGLPTSTTVSIISEMVGASIAVALWLGGGHLGEALTVINTGPVLGIYSGIFLSVVVAFTSAALIMFVIRLIYSHDLERTFPRMGWLWTGLSFAGLAYFVLFKGLKNAALLGGAAGDFLHAHIGWIVAGAFVAFAIFGVIFGSRPKLVLGAIILCSTGALAMAFAGNDLVNFIGPSVAAAQAALVEGIRLSGKVKTPPWALLVAGAVMVAALWRSRKARRVTDTEIRLAASGTTEQRFRTNLFARTLVYWSQIGWSLLTRATPRPVKQAVGSRTEPPPPSADTPPYDLLRASVNLTVASLLISVGTANKLPLSTTYITFTAAMGAALADRTWRSEDADQRVAGILTVLGGWVVTGFLAAFGGFVMASIVYLGGAWGVLLAAAAVAGSLWRLNRVKAARDEHG
jgi:phosphate/sulfate permease